MDNRSKDTDNEIFLKIMPILLVLLFLAIAPSIFCQETHHAGLLSTWRCPNAYCGYENWLKTENCVLCGTRRPRGYDLSYRACNEPKQEQPTLPSGTFEDDRIMIFEGHRYHLTITHDPECDCLD